MTESVFPLHTPSSIERRGLRDHVYDRVLYMLLGTNITPGTRLSIDAIARDLDVSPTPVREALVQMERTGLVTRVANKGYRVAPPLADDRLEALFDARIVLECGAIALAAADSPRLVPLLESALDAQIAMTVAIRAAADAGSIPVELLREYFTVDWRFHQLIFEATHNPFLIDMSDSIATRVHRMRQTVQTGVSDADDAVLEHRAVLDAFALGPDAAAAAMRSHIEKVRERSRRDSVR
jgi:DNA-binding GntR family transcriptional regulator